MADPIKHISVGPLPAGDERHLKAVKAVVDEHNASLHGGIQVDVVLDTYFRSLAEQGVCLVDRDEFASEVAEWLRSVASRDWGTADSFLRRFGGGDEE